MKQLKILSAVLGAAMVFALAGTADAKGAGAKHAKHAGVHGKIASIDSNSKSFTITTGGKKNPKTVQVMVGAAAITAGGKPNGTLADLKVGDKVTVDNATSPTQITDSGQGHHKGGKKAK